MFLTTIDSIFYRLSQEAKKKLISAKMKFTTSTLVALNVAALANAAAINPRQNNLQTFTGSLGGSATPVLNSGDAKRPFSVKGDTFVNLSAALQRSCDQQFNACSNKANGGDKTISVSACQNQKGKWGGG